MLWFVLKPRKIKIKNYRRKTGLVDVDSMGCLFYKVTCLVCLCSGCQPQILSMIFPTCFLRSHWLYLPTRNLQGCVDFSVSSHITIGLGSSLGILLTFCVLLVEKTKVHVKLALCYHKKNSLKHLICILVCDFVT